MSLNIPKTAKYMYARFAPNASKILAKMFEPLFVYFDYFLEGFIFFING
jgi:hypothetical protein